MIRWLYESMFIDPLRKLYLFGPGWLQFGFWGGKPEAEICQSLTLFSESFWLDNMKECKDLIHKRFFSFQVSVEIVLYFLGIFYCVKFITELFWFGLTIMKKPSSSRIYVCECENRLAQLS